MAKPQINRISHFDAAYDIPVSFSWMLFQIYQNRIIIYKNATLETVYDKTIRSMSFIHTIPAGTLVNGETYIIQCQVFDERGNSSDLSNKYYFKTYSTPQLIFENVVEDQTVTASSYTSEVFYFQRESEPLSSYKFAIYDSYKTLINETPDTACEGNRISYTYKGLSTETTYYIRCYGITKNNLSVDTGYHKIYVDYGSKQKYARLYVENDKYTGGINYHTNIRIILPDGYDTYTYENGKINLIDKTIIYKEGFKINGDFTMKVSGSGLYRNGTIVIFKNCIGDIIISAYIYNDNTIRYKLTATNGISNYLIYSDPLFCSNKDLITITIKRINGLYDLKVFTNTVQEG